MCWPLHRTAVDRPSIRRSLSLPAGLAARRSTTAFHRPGPGMDGTASSRTVDEVDEGAKEKMEERRSGIV